MLKKNFLSMSELIPGFAVGILCGLFTLILPIVPAIGLSIILGVLVAALVKVCRS